MKRLAAGVALALGFAVGASAQEKSAAEIEREIDAAIARAAQPSATRSLSPSRAIVNENGVDGERPPFREQPATPAPPPPTPAVAQAGGSGCESATTFKQIYFELGSAAIAGDGTTQGNLGNLASVLALPKFQTYRFQIRGHTDATGSLATNLALSEKRAMAVTRFLIASGVPADRVRPVGLGPLLLADPSQPASKVNRRVEVCLQTAS